MASQTPRILAELAPHSLQLAVVGAGGRLEGFKESALDAAAVAATLAELAPGVKASSVEVLLVPAAGFTARAKAEDAAAIRTVKSLLAHAETVSQGIPAPLSVIAVDAVSGARVDTVGSAPWVLSGVATAQVDAAKAQLASVGLAAGSLRLALPARIGAVVTALQDMPESTRVLVWQIGENDAQLACVSASGCEAAGVVAAGFTQIFEAVQAGLGLKFRSAAAKLFFNNDYDFSETAGPVAERIAAVLRPAIAALGCSPTALHVAGLPAGQAWLASAVAGALEVSPLTPDMAAFCVQCGLNGPAVGAALPTSALSLLYQAAPRDGGAWIADWLDANAAVTAPAPVAPVAPVAAPAASAVPKVAPAPLMKAPPAPAAPAPVAAKSVSPAPIVKPAPVVAKPAAAAVATVSEKTIVAAAAPAVAPAPAKAITPAPIVIKPEPAPQPVVQSEPEVIEQPAVQTSEEPKSAARKKPVALFAAIGAVVVLGGAAAFFLANGKKGEAAAPVAPQISQEEARLREEEQARMLADELKTPRSFRNERYSFEVSDRGFLRKLIGVGNKPIIDEFGWIELQGTFTTTAKPFYAGTMGDTDFKPTINKTIRDGKVVFEISGTHPRFTVQTLVTCLPTSLQIETTFNAVNMEDLRGPITGVYMVKMNRQSLSLGQRATVAPGQVTFATVSGAADLKFDANVWGQPGEKDKQSVLVGANLIFFHFAGGADPKHNVLKAELTLP